NGERASKRSDAGSASSRSTPERRWLRPPRRIVRSASVRRSVSVRRCCSMRARATRASSATGAGGVGGAVVQEPSAPASRSAPAMRLLLLSLGRCTLDPELVLPRLPDLVLHLGGGGALRVDLERLLPRVDRLVGEIVLDVGVTQVLVEDRVLLGQAHRTLQLAQRLLIPPLLVVGPAQAVDEVAVLGLDGQRLLDELNRLGEVGALFGVHVADVVVRLGVLRIERDHLAKGAHRVVEVLLLLLHDSELEM